MCINQIQDGLFPALASALIILAECSRVFLLSDSSAKYSIFSCPGSSILSLGELLKKELLKKELLKTSY